MLFGFQNMDLLISSTSILHIYIRTGYMGTKKCCKYCSSTYLLFSDACLSAKQKSWGILQAATTKHMKRTNNLYTKSFTTIIILKAYATTNLYCVRKNF